MTSRFIKPWRLSLAVALFVSIAAASGRAVDEKLFE